MKSKMTTLLVAAALAVTTTATLAGSSHCKRHYCYGFAAHVNDHAASYDYYNEWRYRRLYEQRDGYYPDYRRCFPGVCRDNPYY